MPITDDELDKRLRALATPDPELSPDAARLIVATASETNQCAGTAGGIARAHKSTPLGGKRRAWTIAGVLALIGALAIPTTAVASRYFQAETGELGQPGYTEEIPGDEWVDLGASDIADYIASVAPRELPAPQAFDWDAAVATVSQQYVRSFGGEQARGQRIGIIRSFEQELWLAWLAEWLEADRAGDDSRMAAAHAQLAEIPDWPAFTETDGGGIRYVMWNYVARMGTPDAQANRDAAQALLQLEVIDPVHNFPVDQTTGEPIDAETAMAQLTGTRAQLSRLWDGADRTATIDSVFADFAAITTEEDASPGTQWWVDHERALRDIAAAAGHPNPKPSRLAQPLGSGTTEVQG